MTLASMGAIAVGPHSQEASSDMLQQWSRPRRRLLLLPTVSILGLLVALGAGAWVWQEYPRPHAAKSAGPTASPVPVHAALVGRQDFPIYLDGLGTAQAWNTITVRSRVDGQVEKISFEEGQPVNEGDILVELDARPFQAAVDQAAAKIVQDQANLVSASADLDRTTKLVANGYATKQLFDQQTANVNQLNALIKADEAALVNAKVALSYTTIRAPISGRVGLRNIDIGNIVHATDQNGIVTIAQIHPIAVVFTAPEDRLSAITRGLKTGLLKLRAFTPDGKSMLADGTLAVVNNEIDTGSGTIRLKGRFENKDDALWPGLSVSTRLLIDTLKGAVVAPEGAVQHGPQGLFAYVVKPDRTVVQRDLKVGAIEDGAAVIEAGLAPGDEVVTSGQYRVAPGALVAIQPESNERTATKQSSRQVE